MKNGVFRGALLGFGIICGCQYGPGFTKSNDLNESKSKNRFVDEYFCEYSSHLHTNGLFSKCLNSNSIFIEKVAFSQKGYSNFDKTTNFYCLNTEGLGACLGNKSEGWSFFARGRLVDQIRSSSFNAIYYIPDTLIMRHDSLGIQFFFLRVGQKNE